MRVSGVLRMVRRLHQKSTTEWQAALPLKGAGQQAQDTVLAAVVRAGFSRPTPTQRVGLAPLLSGRDTVIIAETGSGKTLAYLIPIAIRAVAAMNQQASRALPDRDARIAGSAEIPNVEARPPAQRPGVNQIPDVSGATVAIHSTEAFNESCDDSAVTGTDAPLLSNGHRGPTSAVVVPSHELAVQVADLYNLVLADVGTTAAVVSSSSYLEIGPRTSLLVGTPGSLARQALDDLMPRCDTLVFDEADALMGSSESAVWQIVTMFRRLKRVKPGRGWRRPKTSRTGPPQLVFVGATMPAGTKRSTLERIQMAIPNVECIRTSGAHALVNSLDHSVVRVPEAHTVHTIHPKLQVLRETLANLPQDVGTVLVFANTVARAETVAAEAPKWGWRVAELHKKVDPNVRQSTVTSVARREPDAPQLVVATDIAARGLDMPTISHVIQFDFAPDVTSFIHRVGRTARNGKKGKAISLVDHGEQLVADAVNALLSSSSEDDKLFDPLFSRKRSLRRKSNRQKRHARRSHEQHT